jgi:hypothetical protein
MVYTLLSYHVADQFFIADSYVSVDEGDDRVRLLRLLHMRHVPHL